MWLSLGREFTKPNKKHAGFVYLIENTKNKKKYIGKKLFWKKQGHKVVESNWRNYWGSSKALQEDVKRLGEKHFIRTILRLCETRSEMSYFETKEQFVRNVLIDDNYYNGIIHCRIKASDSLKRRVMV